MRTERISRDAGETRTSEFELSGSGKRFRACPCDGGDRSFDNLKIVREAGWSVPKDHPDLFPPTEFTRVIDLLKQLAKDSEAESKPIEFGRLLSAATDHATALHKAFESQRRYLLSARFSDLSQSCKNCHIKFRN